MKRLLMIATLGMLVLLGLAWAGCAVLPPQPTEEGHGYLPPPQPIEKVYPYAYPPDAYRAPGIDEQIYRSDVIVVATLQTATAAVQTVPSETDEAPTYLPMEVLTFQASEYLKGTGPTTFTVEVLDNRPGIYSDHYNETYAGYLTSAEAQTVADNLIAGRHTTWDNRPGVLFLKGPLAAVAPAATRSGNQAYGFVHNYYGAYSNFSYSVSGSSRAWLPAESVPVAKSGSEGKAADPEYITDGAENPQPTMTLSALKTRISNLDTLITADAGVEGYYDCVRSTVYNERYFPSDYVAPMIDVTIGSGLSARTDIDPGRGGKSRADKYHVYSDIGEDAALFETIIVDDDTDAANGFEGKEVTTRPLPAGKYIGKFQMRHWTDLLCNFQPSDNNYVGYNVTVTAPAGTLHEAFFDPVTVGTAVKADGSNGVLKPAMFTDVNGASATLERIAWEPDVGGSGTVKLQVNPPTGLTDQEVNFIALDGSVSLSLQVANATVDAANRTLSWAVGSQPWQSGDKLMLRIRKG